MLEDRVDAFVADALNGAKLQRRKSKYVNDPLWGTIELRNEEIEIIDTPLLQRLKRIHQTGFVYQTFPSARHTRFDHTLGVIHLAGRIAETLRRKYPRRCDEKSVQKVRFAALMHDTGHSAFSHTSEEFYSLSDDMLDFQRRHERFRNSGAGEILSYLITTSNAFRGFFQKLKKRIPGILVDVDDFALLIAGKPTSRDRQFEADIISGPFDADKLDYFPRDGRAAGVQLALDFERLLHCMELIELDNLQDQRTWTLIVNRGGFNPIQQLLFARATLTATVYHHHKVRACDAMVKSCFAWFKDKGLKFRKCPAYGDGILLDSAASFLNITDDDVFAEALLHDQKEFQSRLLRDLINRRLFKRILTISSRTIDGFKGNAREGRKYRRLLDMRENPSDLRAISKEVWRRTINSRCTEYEVCLDVPTTPTFDKAGRARIRVGNRGSQNLLMKLAEFIPVEQWVDTYNQWYSQCYLFGPESATERTKIAKAALAVLERRFGLRLLKEAIAEDIRPAVFAQHEP